MFVLEPRHRGPQDPMAPTPPRPPGSIRRTASIDTNSDWAAFSPVDSRR